MIRGALSFLKRSLIFIALSLVFLEIGVRALVALDMLHAQVALGRHGTDQLEDIVYDGIVVQNAVAAGGPLRNKTISAYSGYYGVFDDSISAVRILVMGSSYTEGWSPNHDRPLYAEIAAKQLEEKLGKRVQFADASANSAANLAYTYAIYGAKIASKRIPHDVLVVELSLASFHPGRREVDTLDTYSAAVRGDSLIRKAIRHLYSVRFLMLAADTVSFGVLALEPPVQRRSYARTEDTDRYNRKMRMIYMSNRPHFDIAALGNVDAEEKEFAEKVTQSGLVVDHVFQSLKKINGLAREQGVKVVLMVFPEFLREELITIVNEMNQIGVEVIYLDALKDYANREVWRANHPYTPIGQELMGRDMAEQLLPILQRREKGGP